jgi:glycosyltransferase involved in cell wall biosynthesis
MQAARLLEDEDSAQKIIRNAFKEIDKYSREIVREDWLKLYRSFTSEK